MYVYKTEDFVGLYRLCTLLIFNLILVETESKSEIVWNILTNISIIIIYSKLLFSNKSLFANVIINITNNIEPNMFLLNGFLRSIPVKTNG